MDWNFYASSKQRHSFLKWSPKWSVLHVFLYSILHMCDLYFSTFCFCLVTHFYIFQLGKLSQKWFYCRIPRDKSLLIFFFLMRTKVSCHSGLLNHSYHEVRSIRSSLPVSNRTLKKNRVRKPARLINGLMIKFSFHL